MLNPLYTYILNIWLSLVRFYGISTIVGYLMPNSLYTYILNIWFGLVGFYGISNIAGYLMPNSLYTYILNIWFGLVGFYGISTIVGYLYDILKWARAHFLHTDGFKYFSSYTNNSTNYQSFVCTQLNGTKFCFVSIIIYIENQSLVYTQFND